MKKLFVLIAIFLCVGCATTQKVDTADEYIERVLAESKAKSEKELAAPTIQELAGWNKLEKLYTWAFSSNGRSSSEDKVPSGSMRISTDYNMRWRIVADGKLVEGTLFIFHVEHDLLMVTDIRATFDLHMQFDRATGRLTTVVFPCKASGETGMLFIWQRVKK